MNKYIDADVCILSEQEAKMNKSLVACSYTKEFYGHSVTVRFYRLKFILDIITKEYRK